MATWTITDPCRLTFDEEVNRLDVSLVAGRLNVVGTDGPARLEINTKGDVPVLVQLENGRLSVNHDMPKTWRGLLTPVWWWLNGKRRFSADVSLAIPYQTPASLRMVSGTAVASGVRADLSVDCTSGRVTLLGVAGRIHSKVISGPIEAVGCAGQVSLETVSGEITLADSEVDHLDVKTISGAITADLDNPPEHSRVNLQTVSGEITIRVREDSDLRVNLSATGGRVTSAFPGLAVDGGRMKSVQGVLGAGSGKLHANAISGNISLLCRPVDDDFGREAGPANDTPTDDVPIDHTPTDDVPTDDAPGGTGTAGEPR